MRRTPPPATYDRRLAERYWGVERRRLGETFRIVLSAGEPLAVNAAYHYWETETLVRSLPRGRRRLVLDLACGLGRVASVLAARGVRVVGADNARAMLQAARQAVRGGRRRPAVGWVQAVSHEIPLAGASVDAVICLGLLEHLPPALQRATLAEAWRVLKPGGALLLVLNNDRSLLLRGSDDNRYRRARQLENGYFCGLVARRALVRQLERQGATVEARGSNAHYALLRHALRGKPAERDERVRARLFREAAARDLAAPAQGEFGLAFADHYFYRAMKPARPSGRRPSRRYSPRSSR
jgi:SAM-dependent methyltransferase